MADKKNKTCSFPDCGKPVFVQRTSLGPLCDGHYRQFKILLKKGLPLVLKPLRDYFSTPKTSDPSQCCQVKIPDPQDPAKTYVCGRPCWGKNAYCQSHQRQLDHGEPFRPIRNWTRQVSVTCQAEGCQESPKVRGYCSRHYNQTRNQKQKDDHDQNKNSGSSTT